VTRDRGGARNLIRASVGGWCAGSFRLEIGHLLSTGSHFDAEKRGLLLFDDL